MSTPLIKITRILFTKINIKTAHRQMTSAPLEIPSPDVGKMVKPSKTVPFPLFFD